MENGHSFVILIQNQFWKTAKGPPAPRAALQPQLG